MNSRKPVIPSGAQRSRGIPTRDLLANMAGSLDCARDDGAVPPGSVASPRAIEIQIEELVLYGFQLGDRYLIGEAIEHELARLLGEQDVPFSMRCENATDELKAPTFKAALGAKPPAIGRQIAQAVYEGLSQ